MEITHSSILPVELNSLLATGCCLVDVREPIEHAEESITTAKLIPLGQLERRAAEINRDQPLVVMCRSGKRGSEALKKLQALGFTGARNLDGGILAWKSAGFPVATAGKKVFPLMQQVQLTIGLGVLTGAILALTVNPNWVFLCAFFGAGLTMAGSTGWCGLAILMSKMPWNRVSGQSCCALGNCANPN
jgi:rhodanese-related sulfurtransferase